MATQKSNRVKLSTSLPKTTRTEVKSLGEFGVSFHTDLRALQPSPDKQCAAEVPSKRKLERAPDLEQRKPREE